MRDSRVPAQTPKDEQPMTDRGSIGICVDDPDRFLQPFKAGRDIR